MYHNANEVMTHLIEIDVGSHKEMLATFQKKKKKPFSTHDLGRLNRSHSVGSSDGCPNVNKLIHQLSQRVYRNIVFIHSA